MKKTVAQLWEEIFIEYNVLEEIKKNGAFIITADQIRKYKEPRLMAKFDYSKQLPSIFKDHKLGILPIKNGEYIIGEFSLFQKISNTGYEKVEIQKVTFPEFIETIDPDNIYSESNALNVASISGMFEEVFGEHLLETIQGKMRTNTFNFNIDAEDFSLYSNIDINGVAIEIDGGYESKSKVVLVEAKNYLPDDFVIRQLYYPYRHWHDKVTKEIIPVFFAYENGIYNMFIYEFEDLYNYNSLKLKEIKRFIISNEKNEQLKFDFFNVIKLQEELPQDEVPFPQADSFSKVIATLELIDNGINTAQLISKELDFDVRQGKYYIDALRYLNLVDRDQKYGEYRLTERGFETLNASINFKIRNRNLIIQILDHKPFYDVYRYYLENNEMPNKEYLKSIIRKYIPNMAEETVNRRASTLKGWIQWIIGAQI